MSEQVVCGIDVGSSAVKVTVLHPERGILGTGDAAAPLGSPKPGWSEVAITDWWTAVCHAIPEALASAGVNASAVAGVAATGMVPAVVVFDDVGNPLRAGILQNDARAVTEITELAGALTSISLPAPDRHSPSSQLRQRSSGCSITSRTCGGALPQLGVRTIGCCELSALIRMWKTTGRSRADCSTLQEASALRSSPQLRSIRPCSRRFGARGRSWVPSRPLRLVRRG